MPSAPSDPRVRAAPRAAPAAPGGALNWAVPQTARPHYQPPQTYTGVSGGTPRLQVGVAPASGSTKPATPRVPHLANIGDTRSLILHPASTTHRQLTVEQRVACGAGDDVVRLSIGIESVEDLIADLDFALAAE